MPGPLTNSIFLTISTLLDLLAYRSLNDGENMHSIGVSTASGLGTNHVISIDRIRNSIGGSTPSVSGYESRDTNISIRHFSFNRSFHGFRVRINHVTSKMINHGIL